MSRFVAKGADVIVKPNVRAAARPSTRANDEPTVVATLVDLALKAGRAACASWIWGSGRR